MEQHYGPVWLAQLFCRQFDRSVTWWAEAQKPAPEPGDQGAVWSAEARRAAKAQQRAT